MKLAGVLAKLRRVFSELPAGAAVRVARPSRICRPRLGPTALGELAHSPGDEGFAHVS